MSNIQNAEEFVRLLEAAEERAMSGRGVDLDVVERLGAMALEENKAATEATEDPVGVKDAPDAPVGQYEGGDALVEALCEAADRVRRAHAGEAFDACSIVNGRSGRCSENCKWCSQAAGHHTGCAEYLFVPEEEYFDLYDRNAAAGVGRFSIVCSGRKVSRRDLRVFCDLYRRSAERGDMKLCASMGLLDVDDMAMLREAGVTRYHCNLETAASYFPTLCTSHTHADKLRTIAAARQAGLEVCSGGIIGMGETLRQRLELVAEAVEAGAVSVPVNLLNPIAGTPLEGTPLLAETDVVVTCALMRLVAPKVQIRFAGGRARVSRQATVRMLHGGINGAIVGDMLTTPGNSMADDLEMFRDLGFTL